MRAWLIAVCVFVASGLAAQEIEVTPLEPLDLDAIIESVIEEDENAVVPTATVNQAILRGIDKLDGTLEDIQISSGTPVIFGSLTISMTECRYPEDNPSGDAFAFLSLEESDHQLFAGWMIASSPALNALDHQRYDVWVLRCKTSETVGG